MEVLEVVPKEASKNSLDKESTAYLKAVCEILPRKNRTLCNSPSPIKPFIVSHREAMPMYGNAACNAWKVLRDVIEDCHLQDSGDLLNNEVV